MKLSRFSEEQIIGVLKEHQVGMSAADLCRKHGISDATFYKWRSKYGGMEVSDARKLKTLEEENRKLKKLLAEQLLDNSILKEMLGKTFDAWFEAKRRGMAIIDKSYSQRRACRQVGPERKSFRYVLKRPDDAAIHKRLRELAMERRRFGYRRLHILLRREGIELNHKKLYRLYKEERLIVRKRAGRKRALGTRAPDDDSAGTEPALVSRLRVRLPDR